MAGSALVFRRFANSVMPRIASLYEPARGAGTMSGVRISLRRHSDSSPWHRARSARLQGLVADEDPRRSEME